VQIWIDRFIAVVMAALAMLFVSIAIVGVEAEAHAVIALFGDAFAGFAALIAALLALSAILMLTRPLGPADRRRDD